MKCEAIMYSGRKQLGKSTFQNPTPKQYPRKELVSCISLKLSLCFIKDTNRKWQRW
jgi:hypothetical protein